MTSAKLDLTEVEAALRRWRKGEFAGMEEHCRAAEAVDKELKVKPDFDSSLL